MINTDLKKVHVTMQKIFRIPILIIISNKAVMTDGTRVNQNGVVPSWIRE